MPSFLLSSGRAAAAFALLAGALGAPPAAAQAGAIAGQAVAGLSSGGGVVLHSGAVIPLASTPVLTGGSLPGGVAGVAYSQSLSATGGTPPYTYALAAGSSLPAGMSLSAGGVLSGAPTAAGHYGFSVQVTDAAAQTATVTYVFSVAAAPGPGGPATPVAVPLGGPWAGTLLALLMAGGAATARRRQRKD